MDVVEWGRERADDLAALCDDTMADEKLTPDELLACCWDDPGVVFARPGGEAVASAVLRRWGDFSVGYLKLLAVHPGARRLGHGRQLLSQVEEWAFDQGAAQLRMGGSAPFYFWPGIDFRQTAMLCLAEAAGYEADAASFNMSCPTTFRAKPPAGVEVRRVIDDADARAVLAFAADEWPQWEAELERGVEQGGAVAAFHTGPDDAGGAVLGFACHSVCRAGWVGPMATTAKRQAGGIGSALLGELCRDLMVAGHTDAEICWVGPARFYAKSAGATVSRVFQMVGKKRAAAHLH